MQVPMSSPALTDADVAAVKEVLETRYLSLGPKIEAFASYVGTEDATLASVRLSQGLCLLDDLRLLCYIQDTWR